ncbi:hypothetical protein COB52_02320 [Candidatus Kaiserbacteria bacterium]|nr:MAG: hypothetical protein COB52_02320 [Candidatus Kaiserbacteria bacterium]
MLKNALKAIVMSIIILEARIVLLKYKPRIIAVTGSVGKTSTKDAIYTALRSSLFIRKSRKSFNSEIGIPITIIGCDSGWNSPFKWLKNIFEGLALIFLPNHYPKWLVLEVGTDHPGDIKAVAKWLKPEVVVVTALPDVPVHVGNFKDADEVVKEKKELVKAMRKNGVLVLAGDDKLTAALSKEFPDATTYLYGVEAHNDVSASNINFQYKDGKLDGMKFRVEESGSSMPIEIKDRVGHHQVYPVLAAFAVARALDTSPISAAKALVSEKGPNGRMKILKGFNNTTLIDDSYNSSPSAVRAALTTLKKIEVSGKKIAVLGDMLELGRYSAEAHKKVGVQVAGVADILVTVGTRAKGIVESAKKNGFSPARIFVFNEGEAQKAGKKVRELLEEGDVVLLKGSQTGIRLEKAIRELMEDPSRSKELLVRQNEEWLRI